MLTDSRSSGVRKVPPVPCFKRAARYALRAASCNELREELKAAVCCCEGRATAPHVPVEHVRPDVLFDSEEVGRAGLGRLDRIQ